MSSFAPRIAFVLGLLALLTPAPGGPVAAASSRIDGEELILKAARIYVLERTAYLEDAWIHVRDGKIVQVGQGAPVNGVRVVDLGTASIIPGLVSMHARTFAGVDPKGLGPQYVSADKFNAFADFSDTWEYGITSGRIAPPVNRFIGGVGSVVKFGGDPETAAVLRRVADVLVNFNEEGGRGEEPIEEIPVPSSGDVPLPLAQRRRPQTRLGRLPAFEDVIAVARDVEPGEDPRVRALAEFLGTHRPFRLDARRAPDILQAIEAIHRTGVPAYLNGVVEAWAVAEAVAKAKVPVVVEFETALDDLGGDDFDPVRPWRRDDRAAARLEALGVEVIIGGESDDLLLAAAFAVGGGMEPRAALAAVTSRPAKLLGIGDRTGSLRAGLDADLVVLNGPPFAARSHVQETWVAGRRAWSRQGAGDAVLVRAGKIYDGLGGVILDGEVLIEDGKIIECGHRVSFPKKARVIDAGPDAVVTPGFIDAHGHLGLEGDGTSPEPQISLADAYAVARADFADVARSGVTTVVVGPRRPSRKGSQMVAIKTNGVGADEVVAKGLAALTFPMGATAEQTEEALEDLLKKGEEYHKKWLAYEEELAKWRASKGSESSKAAVGEEKTDQVQRPRGEDPISGTWAATISGGPLPDPESGEMKLSLGADDSVTGTITNPVDVGSLTTVSGTFDGKTLTLTLDVEDIPFGKPVLSAVLEGPDLLRGSVSVGGIINLDFEAKRISKTTPKITIAANAPAQKTAAGEPKKPRADPQLEPFRPLFSGKIGAVLAPQTPGQIVAVANAFAKREIVPILIAPDSIHLVLDQVKDKVAVALPRQLMRSTRRRPVFVPNELERAGVRLVFQSSAESAAARLPRLARAAVREGMSADVALVALTSGAANLLKLDDVVGSLQRGRDGDVLIFDGEPFEARTRLKTVLVRGKEVR